MENPSETLPTGGNPWKDLLITASILSCWIQLTSAHSAPIKVVPNPPYGTVGKSIILDIPGFSRKFYSCTWYRKSPHRNNRVAFYRPHSRVHESRDIRKQVLHNGSLVIHDLTLNDTDDYIVQFSHPIKFLKVTARGHLAVFAEENSSSHSGGTIAGGVIAGLAGVAFIGALIYFLFFKNRGSTRYLSEKSRSASREGDKSNFYENAVGLKGSTSSTQHLVSSPATLGDPFGNSYQMVRFSESKSPWSYAPDVSWNQKPLTLDNMMDQIKLVLSEAEVTDVHAYMKKKQSQKDNDLYMEHDCSRQKEMPEMDPNDNDPWSPTVKSIHGVLKIRKKNFQTQELGGSPQLQ